MDWFLGYGCNPLICVVVTGMMEGGPCRPSGKPVPVCFVLDNGGIVDGTADCKELAPGYEQWVWFLSPAEELEALLDSVTDVTLLMEGKSMRFEFGERHQDPPFGWW